MSARLPIIRGALKVVASRLFVTRQAPLGWLVRVESEAPGQDSGWRIYSADDTPEFLDQDGSLVIIPFNDAGLIEPMIMPMYFQPVGTELRLLSNLEGTHKAWFDENNRDEDDLPTEVALDDAFWDQFDCDYDAWSPPTPCPRTHDRRIRSRHTPARRPDHAGLGVPLLAHVRPRRHRRVHQPRIHRGS